MFDCYTHELVQMRGSFISVVVVDGDGVGVGGGWWMWTVMVLAVVRGASQKINTKLTWLIDVATKK